MICIEYGEFTRARTRDLVGELIWKKGIKDRAVEQGKYENKCEAQSSNRGGRCHRKATPHNNGDYPLALCSLLAGNRLWY